MKVSVPVDEETVDLSAYLEGEMEEFRHSRRRGGVVQVSDVVVYLLGCPQCGSDVIRYSS